METSFLPQTVLALSVFGSAFFLVRKNPVFTPAIFKLSPTSSNYRFSRLFAILRFVLGFLSLGALLAYAFGFDRAIPQEGSADVVFVLDVSKSMDAPDAGTEEDGERTSRISAAKSLIERLVRSHPENRHSLWVFNDRSYPAIPPTNHSESFLLLLSGISTKYARNGTTDLASTLSSFVSELRASGEKTGNEPWKSEGKRRLVVVLTDGWDAEDTPSSETFLNAVFSIKSETAFLIVGLGTKEGSTIPVGTDLFGEGIELTYGGKKVVTKRNDEALSRLAKSSGGEYGTLLTDVSQTFSSQLRTVIKGPVSDFEKTDAAPAPSKNGPSVALLAFVLLFCVSTAFPDRFLRTVS